MPRKPKMIMDPAWVQSDEGQEYFRVEKLRIEEMATARRDFIEDYFPEDYGKQLPTDGAWIIILRTVEVARGVPAAEIQKTYTRMTDRITGTADTPIPKSLHGKANIISEIITVPHLSIWFAVPTTAEFSALRGVYPRQALIQTPQGQVSIWPHEYNIVRDLAPYLQMSEEEGFYINFLSKSGQFDQEQFFYLQSRGLSKAQVQTILLPTLKGPILLLFHFPPGLQ